MKVKCLTKSYKVLSNEYIKDIFEIPENFHLVEEKEYTVYGLLFEKGLVFYLINDEGWGELYPSWNPAPLFKVTKNQLSKYWIFSEYTNKKFENRTFIIFKEWAEDEYFYTGLVDGEEKEKKVWRSVMKKMDEEF